MAEVFKVLTLNCWGVPVPFLTVRKNDRLAALVTKLKEGTYDIVVLQEIWTPNDFSKIKYGLSAVYPHSNYYYSHVIGSGSCIFSKWPIQRILFFPYTCNGYPQRILECDWFCGKGIGLAQITTTKGYKINVYDTHLIARYELDYAKDTNEAHRIVQTVELIQFILMTANSADAIIVAGDLNMSPFVPALQLLRQYLGLSDAWLDNADIPPGVPTKQHELDGCTCDRADNPYRNKKWCSYYVNGERLDYIFFRVQNDGLKNRFSLRCESCWLDMRAVPGDKQGLHYSDHDGVGAKFTITRLTDREDAPAVPATSANNIETLLKDIDGKLIIGMQRCSRGQWYQLSIAAAIAIALFLVAILAPIYVPMSVFFFISSLLGAALAATIWSALIVREGESRSLRNSRQTVAVILENLTWKQKTSCGDMLDDKCH